MNDSSNNRDVNVGTASFFGMMSKYFAHYKRYIVGTLVMNVLAAVFNVFSFTILLPILQILFKVNTERFEFIPWGTGGLGGFVDVAKNNGYYYSQQLIDAYGPATTLLLLGIILSVLTLLKTATYFGGSAMLMPLRTGVIRDIRQDLYQKILSLPLSFFSDERKGDILTRASTDVNEVDASINSSLDMVIKPMTEEDRDIDHPGQSTLHLIRSDSDCWLEIKVNKGTVKEALQRSCTAFKEYFKAIEE